jgi:hypothetical protein
MIKTCPHCGAKMNEYKFSFNKGLRSCLWKMIEARGDDHGVPIREIGLTSSEWTNFQKLRYWNLIEHVDNAESRHKGGWWKLSQTAIAFIEGRIKIPAQVIMYRNKVKSFEGQSISFADFHPGYDHRKDYKDQLKSQTATQLEMAV